MITLEERAHDLANATAHWQVEQLAKNAKAENKNIRINLHSVYQKYYNELLNAFKQDVLFNEQNND